MNPRSPMQRVRVPVLATGLALIATLLLPACSGGGGTTGTGTGGSFLLLASEPPNNGRLFLNESLVMRLSNPVDLDTASLNSVVFNVFDVVTGKPVAEQVV